MSDTFNQYQDARDALINRIGDYCSYCESPLLAPAVEHIQPKSKAPELAKTWNNFLLACCFCNSIKKDKMVNTSNLNGYFWADNDNTYRAFYYEKDRSPQVNSQLNTAHQLIAQNTLDLTGLDREPTHPKLTKKDRRWTKRNEAWGKAERAKANLHKSPSETLREQIIDTATSTGFWSVWMTVFAEDVDMRRHFIIAFKGTCSTCFDNDTQPIKRPGGNI
ncbi:MAG: HNH endonuclease [Methylococcales bacterium]|nr:HNH endonuclease [Methylococcales bacterium]